MQPLLLSGLLKQQATAVPPFGGRLSRVGGGRWGGVRFDLCGFSRWRYTTYTHSPTKNHTHMNAHTNKSLNPVFPIRMGTSWKPVEDQTDIFREIRCGTLGPSSNKVTTTALTHVASPTVSVRYQQRLVIQRPQRHFHSTANVAADDATVIAPSYVFDPLKFPLSAYLLKQKEPSLDDDESTPLVFLSPEEIELKKCLQEYQEYQSQNDNNTVDPDLLDRLHQAYMAVPYLEEALQVEEMKCQWIMNCHRDTDGDDGDGDNVKNYDRNAYADSIHVQGKLWLRLGDMDRSKPLYEEALENFQQTGNTAQEGHVWISLSGWYYFKHQERELQQMDPKTDLLETAMEYLQRAEPLLDTNLTLLVKCLDNQGLVLRLLGDFKAALDKYQQALQVVVDQDTRRSLRLHVADMITALGQSHQALELYQEILKEYQQESPLLPRSSSATPATLGIQGVLWHNIANLHVQLGEYETAVQEFRQSLQCKQESLGARHDSHPELAKTWNALGALYYGILGEKRQALECIRHVLWIARVHSEYKDHSKDPQVQAALQTISDLEEQLAKEERK